MFLNNQIYYFNFLPERYIFKINVCIQFKIFLLGGSSPTSTPCQDIDIKISIRELNHKIHISQ